MLSGSGKPKLRASDRNGELGGKMEAGSFESGNINRFSVCVCLHVPLVRGSDRGNWGNQEGKGSEIISRQKKHEPIWLKGIGAKRNPLPSF